jgi:hypothetical protein
LTAERVCIGRCGRKLPVDAEHFYVQRGGDGFTRRCKECMKAEQRERKAAQSERRKASPKRCLGVCGRELSRDEFAPDPQGRPRPRCRECELGAELAAELEAAEQSQTKRCTGCKRELPQSCEHFHRHARSPDGLSARCKECVNRDHRARRVEEKAAQRPRVETSSTTPPLGLCDSTSPVRRAMVRRFIEAAPDGRKAQAGKEIRARLARVDRQVAELTAPPFDANDVLLTMAEDAADVDALGAALRRTGWQPEGTM